MENTNKEISGLEYNTGRILKLPEYGRNVQRMVEYLKTIEDKEKRNEQARAVIEVMKIINSKVQNQEQKLWDHLFIIADFDLDVEPPAPFSIPQKSRLNTVPERVPVQRRSMRTSYYGKLVPELVKLVCSIEDPEERDNEMVNLAAFMKMQYLEWNKDTVSDETIFADIERMSGGLLVAPEGMQIGKVQKYDAQRVAAIRHNAKNRRNKLKIRR